MKSNEHGYALLITVLSILLISVLGIGIMTVSSNSIKTSSNERSNQSLYYYAEAGINYKEAIVLNKIDQLYSNAKSDPETFEQTFFSGLQSIINEESTTYLSKDFFKNDLNGDPSVTITINYNPLLSKYDFSIFSSAQLSTLKTTRSVKRDYKIPSDLMKKTTYTVSEVITPPAQSIVTVEDFKSIKDKTFIDDELNMALTKKENLNAQFNVNYKDVWWRFLEITPDSNRDLVNYNVNFKNYPTNSINYKNAPSTSKGSSTLPINQPSVTIDKDYTMGSLPNFSNKELNLKLKDNIEYDLTFDKSFLSYNLSSIKFNVEGNGTLNIVFNNYFTLNSGRKFYINAPQAKVNLIFKDGASIRGDMVAQDIYITKDNFETTLNGKLIANNVYVAKGRFDKDYSSAVQINDLYMKSGTLELSSKEPFIANNITIEKGNIHMATGVGLIANKIFIEEGRLDSLAYTCLQANSISNPKGTTRIDGKANYKELYSKKLYMIINSEINRTPCAKQSVVITDDLPGEENKTREETVYLFKEVEYLIEKGIILEVK